MEDHWTIVDLQEAKEVCKVVRPEDGLFLGLDVDDVGTSSRNKRTKSFRCGANQVCQFLAAHCIQRFDLDLLAMTWEHTRATEAPLTTSRKLPRSRSHRSMAPSALDDEIATAPTSTGTPHYLSVAALAIRAP